MEGPARHRSRRRRAPASSTTCRARASSRDYIEGIATEGITAGCGNGDYCPEREHHERADGRVPGQGLRDFRTCHEDPHEGTGRNRHEPAVHERARALDRVRVRRSSRRACSPARRRYRSAARSPTGRVTAGRSTRASSSRRPRPIRSSSTPIPSPARTPPILRMRRPTFTAVVTAVAPGYAAGGGTVVTAGAPLDADWTLVAVGALQRPGIRGRQLRACRSCPRASTAACFRRAGASRRSPARAGGSSRARIPAGSSKGIAPADRARTRSSTATAPSRSTTRTS